MYHFVCFILLVSMEGIKTSNNTSSPPDTTQSEPNTLSSESYTSMSSNTEAVSTTLLKSSNNCQPTENFIRESDCLLTLTNMKENLPLFMIAFLSLVCILLLLIIMCLACKRRRGVRNDKMVVTKSSRRNEANGGPSEVEVRYSSLKVEIETTPDEEQERSPEEEVGAEAAEVENQVTENQNSANDTTETSETAPTQEVDLSGQTDLKIEDWEKAE